MVHIYVLFYSLKAMQLQLIYLVELNIQYNGLTQPPVHLTSPYIAAKDRMTRLTPGESTQFAHLCSVPSGVPCYIEIEIEGYGGVFRTIFTRVKGYWKASVYSLPV